MMNTISTILPLAFLVMVFSIFLPDSNYEQPDMVREEAISSTVDTQELARSFLTGSEEDIVFIENLGQIKGTEGEETPDVLFLTRSEGVDMFVTASGMTYVFRKNESDDEGEVNYRLDMEFIGMNKDIIVQKEDPIDQQFHYYTSDKPNGISPRAYKRIKIEDLYEGIDLVYYEKEGKVKYDFILKAGADAKQIRMKYKGASSIDIDMSGTVIIKTPLGEIGEEQPFTYTERTGMEIRSKYKVVNNTVLFDVAEYAESETIIIDPVRIWATYYGGDMGDRARSICADGAGNIYITGRTHSTDFPTQTLAGSYNQTTYAENRDAFILKFNSSGERVWATYYGGSASDEGNGVCVDNSDNLYVIGETESTDFPTLSLTGAYNQSTPGDTLDVFILKFDNNGIRQWATYYGGNGLDRGFDVAMDNANNLYVTGETHSTDFPTQSLAGAYNQTTSAGSSDLFILKFNNSGTRQWATYYGGSGYDGRYGTFWYSVGGMCTDGSGNLYVTGSTISNDFPLQSAPGAYYQSNLIGNYTDAFILKFNSSGVRQWATYYGGSIYDGGCDIVTDDFGNVYVAGYTYSYDDFPVHELPGAYNQPELADGSDAFILKFDNNGARLWATPYGGGPGGFEIANGIALDKSNNIYVTGDAQASTTFGNNFPLQALEGAYNQSTHGGATDAFIILFNSSGERTWATYYGGINAERAWGCCTDNSGNFYVSGNTSSDNFPLASLSGAYDQSTPGGGSDVFILRFYELNAAFSASDCAVGVGGSVSFTDQSTGNLTSWNWTFEGGTPATSTAQNPVVTYDAAGSYDVQLIISDGTNSDTLMESDLITAYGSGVNCGSNTDYFPTDPLTHTGTGSSSTTLLYSPPHWDVAFTISDIGEKLKGPASKHYIEKVTVSYIDCSGQQNVYGEYTGDDVSSADILIQDVVQSITVTLSDALDGDSGSSPMSVTLGEVSSCSAPGSGCPDSDGDGVCDADDICPGYDDNIDTDGDGIPDGCDTACPDADADGICDADDVCPGYDDNIDTDGDGIPDGCDNCTSANNDFPVDPLTHLGPGSTSTSFSFGAFGHTDISFVVTDLDAKINGNPNNRYIDLVTVTYTDAGGSQTYGTFSGETTSTTIIDIAGPVYSVTLTLEDGYDGNPPGTLTVNPGTISSCPVVAAPLEVALDDIDLGKMRYDENNMDLVIYPNPASGIVNFRLYGVDDMALLKIYDYQGRILWTEQVKANQEILQLNPENVSLQNGIYFVSLESRDIQVTKHLLVIK